MSLSEPFVAPAVAFDDDVVVVVVVVAVVVDVVGVDLVELVVAS